MKTCRNFIALYFLLLCTAFHASGQSSETRDLPEFSGISLHNSIHVIIEQGNRQSVRLEGPEDVLEEITTEVNGDRLVIGNEDDGFWSWTRQVFSDDYDDVTLYITLEELEELSVSGSGEVTGEGVFQAEDLHVKVSGSGSVSLHTEADFVEADISGSGAITLEGKSETVESSISGSGKLTAENLETEKHTARISGSGRCTIYVTEEIDASISGSGRIRYKGNPQVVNTNISGSGSVQKI